MLELGNVVLYGFSTLKISKEKSTDTFFINNLCSCILIQNKPALKQNMFCPENNNVFYYDNKTVDTPHWLLVYALCRS